MTMKVNVMMMMNRAEGTQFNVHRSYKTPVLSVTCSKDLKIQ